MSIFSRLGPQPLELSGHDFPNAPMMRQMYPRRGEAFSQLCEWMEDRPSTDPKRNAYERCFNYQEIIREKFNEFANTSPEELVEDARQAWERFIWRCEYAITKGERIMVVDSRKFPMPKMGGMEQLGLGMKESQLRFLRPFMVIPWISKDVILPVNSVEFIGEFTVTKKGPNANHK